MALPELMPEGIRKELFLRTGIYRYSDFAVIFAQTIAIVSFYTHRFEPKKLNTSFFLFLLIGALTQDRAFLLVGFASYIINLLPRISFINFVVGLTFLVIPVFILSGLEQNEIIERFTNLNNITLILEELAIRIVLPVISGGYILDATTILFGEGLNYKFFIPWYEYRGLNPYHNSVDSFFVTFFVKHGLVGLTLFLFALLSSLRGQPRWIFIWIILYFITHNGAYQATFLLMMFFLVCIGRNRNV
tara:strand:+ start:81 stop:818 length:738 start_codon:yes stop_codon:yes gene_type:complete